MAKIKRKSGRLGYAFVKELGGAPERMALSKTTRVLMDLDLVVGRVLDFGCGLGFDADELGWEAYDPHYRQQKPVGPFDTIIVNHVANILTRDSRARLFELVNELLTEEGAAYFSVARNIPIRGKAGLRRRIQNYVVLDLPSVFCESEEEIYQRKKNTAFRDKTREFEDNIS